ncbi:hypothetical protein BH11PLA2_BH11PLA2_09010 [soil metagenome]
MLNPITIQYVIRPKRRSLLSGQVSDLFGLSATEPPHVIADNVVLEVRPGDLVLFTGPSGSGKSSLMRAVSEQVNAVDAAAMVLPEVPLIEGMNGTLQERLNTLAACGLSEARLLLRTPSELSDGQRYRFRIAYALAQATPQSFIMLDEFTAMLDRTLAKVVAFNLRKLVTKSHIGVLAATTHEDIIDDLNPDLHLQCHGEGVIDKQRRAVKKKNSASPMMSGCPRGPSPIGRTSLGGITAAITSPSPAV